VIIQQALSIGRCELAASSSPYLDARLLLQHVLEKNHAFLIAYDQEELSSSQERAYRQLLQRASKGEPIPYLVGKAPFFGADYKVNSSVLIPRQETEQLVRAALKWAGKKGRLEVVDVGTGSGCIAIALACHLPQLEISAVDISKASLEVARSNAELHSVSGRIHFYQGSLLEAIPNKVDMVIANLPYIADHEWTTLDVSVKWYEPDIALRGGPDGLAHIRNLLRQAKEKLTPGGAIFLEIGWGQGPDVRQIAEAYYPLAQVSVSKDLAGLDRIFTVST